MINVRGPRRRTRRTKYVILQQRSGRVRILGARRTGIQHAGNSHRFQILVIVHDQGSQPVAACGGSGDLAWIPRGSSHSVCMREMREGELCG